MQEKNIEIIQGSDMPLILKENLNSDLRKIISDESLKNINNILQKITDQPEEVDNIVNNFLSFSNVIKQGTYTVDQYLKAILFTSYQFMGDSIIDSYKKTFPERIKDFVSRGIPENEIYIRASRYNATKLVNLIKEQNTIPIQLLNQDKLQIVINNLMSIGLNPKQGMAQVAALSKLADIIKLPDKFKAEITVTEKDRDKLEKWKELLELNAKKEYFEAQKKLE